MADSLKIIIFDGTFKTTTFISRLAKGLSKNHQIYILGFNEKLDAPIKGIHYVKLGSNSSKIDFVKTTLTLALSKFSIKLLLSTVKHLLKFNRKQLQKQNLQLAVNVIKPDIIHAQWASNIPVLEPILLKNSYPVVFSQRGFHINVRPFIETNSLNYLKHWLPKMAGFHSVSHAISKKGDLIYSNPNKIDRVVYSGLDLSAMSFSGHHKKNKKVNLISVGRAHWVKGYAYAIAACALLKKQHINFTYTIVGVAQEEELIYLRQHYELEDEVVFLDSLPQQHVFEKIKDADAMLLPSIEEGIANVAIEAMALGTLVISTNCGGMQELIEHKKEGWIVPTRNAESLAEALIDFYTTSDSDLDNIREAARKKIEEKFIEENMLQGMERLYIKCLNENN